MTTKYQPTPEERAKLGTKAPRRCPRHGETLKWEQHDRTGNLNQVCRPDGYDCTAGKNNLPFKVSAPRGPGGPGIEADGDTDETEETGEIRAESTSDKRATIPAPAGMSDLLGQAIWAGIEPLIQATLEKERRAILDAVKDRVPVRHEWKRGEVLEVSLAGTEHKLMPEIIETINEGESNIWITGPAGCGKTKLAHDLATALKLEFGMISCTAGLPEWHLLGRSLPNLQTGESVYQISEFVRLYRDGGVFLIDEVDAADANTMLVMNAALSNGGFHVPGIGMVPRHARFICIAAANTYGHGANADYIGRNKLDGSFLDRFEQFATDYDRDLETNIASAIDAKNGPAVCARIWSLRSSMQTYGIKRIVSTRAIVRASKKTRAGKSIDAAMSRLCAAWKPDERSRCGVS